MELTLPEQHLIASLLKGLRRRFEEFGGLSERGLLCHNHYSYFESAFLTLWKSGIAEGFDEEVGFLSYEAGRWCNEFRIRELEDLDLQNLDIDIPELVQAYIGVAVDYGRHNLTSERGLFKPEEEFIKEMKALARCGYLETNGSLFCWTDEVEPLMKSLHLWNAEGEDLGTLLSAEREERIEEWWEKTPELLRRQLAAEAEKVDFMDFFLLLRDRYQSLYLTRTPEGKELRSGELDTLVTQALYKKLRSYRRTSAE